MKTYKKGFIIMIKTFIIALTVFSCAIAFAKPKPSDRKPASPEENVQYGGDPDFDACGSYGVVLVTTVAVRYDKSNKMVFDKIEAGTMVTACEYKGDYTGVVYGKPKQDCGTGGPIKDRKEYKGPCKSGWIKSAFYELLAG